MNYSQAAMEALACVKKRESVVILEKDTLSVNAPKIYSQAVMEALESAGVEFRDSVCFFVEEATLCVNALQP